MAIATVSRISPAALVAALLTVAALAGGCATGKEEQVRKIQARNAYDQAGSNLREGRISLGLAALQEAVELDPDNAMYRNALGVTHLQLRRWPEAQAQFEKAIQLDPNYAEAYHNLGLVMAAQNRLDLAVASYRRALTFPTYPSPELAYHNLGEAYLRQGKVKEAEEALRQAIQLEPKNQFSHYLLGVVLAEAGRKEEARAAFRFARDIDPASSVGKLTVEALKTLGEGG
jgi:Flp pilus assembly protein TadD